MFVFIFVFFGLFSAILVAIPTEFTTLGITSEVQDKEAATFFNVQNVTVYNNTLSRNLTWGPPSLQEDFGLASGQKLEFWWSEHVVPGGLIPLFELRHLTNNFWGWWWGMHWLSIPEPYLTQGQVKYPYWGLQKSEVLLLFDEDSNASYCEFQCEHVQVKLFILTYNQSWTLSESWDNGKLKVYTSYNIDWTGTGTSMWTILMQLLSFQTPNLGVPGLFGSIIAWVISGTLWACIAIIVYAVITAVIPLIPGYKGGG